MLQRLSVALAHVKGGNTSENVQNKICQMMHSLYQAKQVPKKVYNTGFELTVRDMRFAIHFDNFAQHFFLIFVRFGNQSLIVELTFIFKK